jgi:c-di-GMP-binding flagellar brake protein YcgR
MSHNTALAEMKFPQFAINLYGRVEQMNRASIRIRLDTEPVGEYILRPGNEAQLMVVAKGVIYRANVSVMESALPRVTMQFAAPPSAVQRRNAGRRDCDLAVSLRTRNESGYVGAWQEARATDISSSGMRVVFEQRIGIAGEVELQFLLDGSMAFLQNGSTEDYADSSRLSPEMRPVKATARVAHKAMLPDGRLAVGLSFRKVSSFDQLRLMRYTDVDLTAKMF